MTTVCSESIRDKVLAGERLPREEGLELFRTASLLELAELANEMRFRKIPKRPTS